MSDTDTAYAQLARDLADTLMTFARERHDDQKKAIAVLHTELCEMRRIERLEPPHEDPPG
jgi:hypothetical protein